MFVVWTVLFCIAFVPALHFASYLHERHMWNDGVSPSGKTWVYLDTDIHGARRYTDGQRYIFIEHDVDK